MGIPDLLQATLESLRASEEADSTCEGFMEVSKAPEVISGCITVESEGLGVISRHITEALLLGSDAISGCTVCA